jgi:release factor glutamine methyltransferase
MLQDTFKPDYLFDIIISNPPYITAEEKTGIHSNVLDYEPHQALFVNNNDPLQFYKAIEQFASECLSANGSIFLELNQSFAMETEQYFRDKDWQTTLKQDLNGNNRMLHCQR